MPPPTTSLLHRSVSFSTTVSFEFLLLLLRFGLLGELTALAPSGVGAELTPSSGKSSGPANSNIGSTVQLTSGVVRGRVFTPSSQHRLQDVEVFLGIPYAAPPVGKLRFRAPQPVAKWEGIRELEFMPPVCVQAFPNVSTSTKPNKKEEFQLKTSTSRLKLLQRIQPFIEGNQSEDCLYLNVYAPSTHRSTDSRIPVSVIVSSGDSYSWGEGNHVDGSVMAAYTNSIVVTFNYRVGVLGFLPNSLSGTVSANAGLRDQIEVLRWLRLNVASFGGDRDRVTLLGAGRAAAFVHLHMLNPAATGLFKRAALIGGSALSSWALCHDADEQAIQLAKNLLCEPGDPVECFRDRSAQELVQASSTLLVPEHLCGPFGPTPDGDLVPLDVYAATSGYASRSSSFGQHDLLTGVTRWESYQLFNDYHRIHGIETEYRERVLRTLVRNSYLFHQNEILFSISNEYTDWTKSERSTTDILRETAEALSDATVVAPLMEVTTLHSHAIALSKSQRSTYFYVFAYQSTSCDYSHLYSCTPDSEEALSFLLGMPLLDHQRDRQRLNYSRQDAQVSEFMLNYWNNFLRTGRPNSSTIETVNSERPSRPVTEEISWHRFESTHREYLSVEARPRSLQHFDAHRMSLWNRLVPALHRSGDDFNGNNSTEDFIASNLSLPLHGSPVYRLPLLVSLQATSAPMPRSFALDPLLSSVVISTPATTTAVNDGHLPRAAFDVDHLPLSLESLASGPYSKALFITIAVGCSLLVVNLLVFVGTYYQHRTDSEYKTSSTSATAAAKRVCQKSVDNSSLHLDTPSLYSFGQKNHIFKDLSSSEMQDVVHLNSADLISPMMRFCAEPNEINLGIDDTSSLLGGDDIDARYRNVTNTLSECQKPLYESPAGETSV